MKKITYIITLEYEEEHEKNISEVTGFFKEWIDGFNTSAAPNAKTSLEVKE